MKKFFTLRNIMILCGVFVLILGFCLSFAVKGVLEGGGGHVELPGVLYGAKYANSNGHIIGIDKKYRYFDALPVIGYILALLGAIAAVVFALVLKNEKTRKIAVIVAAALALVGAILSMITLLPATHAYAKSCGMTYEQGKQMLDSLGVVEKASALNIIMGILGILGAAAIGASQFLPEKK